MALEIIIPQVHVAFVSGHTIDQPIGEDQNPTNVVYLTGLEAMPLT